MKKKRVQNKGAKTFAESWMGKGYEKGETQCFWLDLLHNVFDVDDPTKIMQFEIPVKTITKEKGADFIDGYITPTKILIEQKSSHVELGVKAKQSDGSELTPYQQARRYAEGLPLSQKPRWIVTCNFKEFWVYDMEKPNTEPQKILLENLGEEYYRLQFLVDQDNENVKREEELSLKAGVLVGKLYDALIKEYINPDENSLRSLNILCVRMVFCLYAEDAGLFETKTSFVDYIKSFDPAHLRKSLIDLFKCLDTKPEDRDKYDTKQNAFPYINGGLFKDEQIEIPNFTQEIVDVIVNYCAPFDWSDISPTIFGAVFESTLNPETRRKGGMHYTSIANIHKVIDPLFMDELEEEFRSIVEARISPLTQRKVLHDFQQKLATLTFLDPACGSGNFLTETYLSLRRLENKVISILNKGEKVLGFSEEFIKVNINQFYGIEINDFAVTVAKTALWIAECQMAEETERLMGQDINLLPLKNHANIVEGNALRMDWNTLGIRVDDLGVGTIPTVYAEKVHIYQMKDDDMSLSKVSESEPVYKGVYQELNVHAINIEHENLIHQPLSCNPIHYDYIIGNPPFSGARIMSKGQKEDVIYTFGKKWQGVGDLDYVCCWYKKAADTIKGTGTRCALFSTNSVSQGSTVANLWKPLFDDGIHIDFAWRPFIWKNETADRSHMAAVHCVVIGFSRIDRNKPKIIYDNAEQFSVAKNINGYLLDMPNIFVERRQHPLCEVPEIGIGNKPIDGGFYLFAEREMQAFIKKEPEAAPYFHEWMGSEEFIKGNKRWCLYLGKIPPAQLLKMPECMKRVRAVREYRLKSTSPPTVKLADKPTRFHVENFPQGNYLLIPRVSSEQRKYIPVGFLSPDIIASDSVHIIPDATHYHFGILTSSVHMAWMRAVCGRLEMRYRYSKDIVYNNFPWPMEANASSQSQQIRDTIISIEQTAQAILTARTQYADCTLAQLYGANAYLFPDLVEAHRANDEAVMAAYGFSPKMTESEIVTQLFKMYQTLTKDLRDTMLKDQG